jgi:tight adherence protein B
MSAEGVWIFVALVFLAVFLLIAGLTMPVFGESRRMHKRLLERLATLKTEADAEVETLLRQKYRTERTPLEQSLESLPGMQTLARLLEQSGSSTPAYRLAFGSAALGVAVGVAGWDLMHLWYAAVLVALAASALPWVRILQQRARRTAKFEEQLPEALDVMKRGLQAGHPFTQCLKLVAQDMEQPIAREFDYIFSEINYGGDLRHALLGFLERVPSVSAMAFVTAVLVQKETGGNLAEILTRITAVIRGRFKLHRRIRTLSAEGRLSAWILMLIPFALFAIISISSPGYFPVLLHNPLGPKLITIAVVMGFIGMVWIRRIIRIVV